ncbi:carbohydrate-binding protein [Bacillus cereus]
MEETPEWDLEKRYVKGDIVTYNEKQYEAQCGMCGIKPDGLDATNG